MRINFRPEHKANCQLKEELEAAKKVVLSRVNEMVWSLFKEKPVLFEGESPEQIQANTQTIATLFLCRHIKAEEKTELDSQSPRISRLIQTIANEVKKNLIKEDFELKFFFEAIIAINQEQKLNEFFQIQSMKSARMISQKMEKSYSSVLIDTLILKI